MKPAGHEHSFGPMQTPPFKHISSQPLMQEASPDQEPSLRQVRKVLPFGLVPAVSDSYVILTSNSYALTV